MIGSTLPNFMASSCWARAVTGEMAWDEPQYHSNTENVPIFERAASPLIASQAGTLLIGEQDGIAVWSGQLVRSAPSRLYNCRLCCFYLKILFSSPYLNGIGINHVPYLVGNRVPRRKDAVKIGKVFLKLCEKKIIFNADCFAMPS